MDIEKVRKSIPFAVKASVDFFAQRSAEKHGPDKIKKVFFAEMQKLLGYGIQERISEEVMRALLGKISNLIEEEKRKVGSPDDIQMLGRIFGSATQQSTAGEAEDFAGEEDTVFDRPLYGPMILLSLDMAGVEGCEPVFGRPAPPQLTLLSEDTGPENTDLPPPVPYMASAEQRLAELQFEMDQRLLVSGQAPTQEKAELASADDQEGWYKIDSEDKREDQFQFGVVTRKPRQGQSRVVMVVLAVCAVIAVAFCAIRMYGARPASEAAASALPREPAVQQPAVPAPAPSIVAPSLPSSTLITTTPIKPTKPKKKIHHFRRPRPVQPERCQELREPPPAPLVLTEDPPVGGGS